MTHVSQQPEAQAPAKQTPPQTFGERFTSMVARELMAVNQGVDLTPFQRRLCQSYFAKLDSVLKEAEIRRMAKSEQYRDVVPVSWENIEMNKLAMDVCAYSSVGLDPMQPNHLNLIPYKNNKTGKYDIGFIIGYRGCELKAKKYGLDVPDEVVVEVVYQNDVFKQIKKDMNNRIESYIFEVRDDFNRGEVVGGFYYLSYRNNPEKNKVEAWNMADINKRKPAYASIEFWGGGKEKDEWFTNPEGKREKKVVTVKVEGWLDEMVYKTMFRAAYNSITIDSQKIDDLFQSIQLNETQLRSENVKTEILNNANKSEIGFDTPINIPVSETKEENSQANINVVVDAQELDIQSAQQPSQSSNNGTLFNQTGPNY